MDSASRVLALHSAALQPGAGQLLQPYTEESRDG